MQNTNNIFQTTDAIYTIVDDRDYEIPSGVPVLVRRISGDEYEIEDPKTGAIAYLFEDDLPLYVQKNA